MRFVFRVRSVCFSMAPRAAPGQTGQLWSDQRPVARPGPGAHGNPSRPPPPAILADAFASLDVAGRPVPVRRCGNAPGVSTGAAAEWLRVNRSVQEVSLALADD